jgi:hypothetical protein
MVTEGPTVARSRLQREYPNQIPSHCVAAKLHSTSAAVTARGWVAARAAAVRRCSLAPITRHGVASARREQTLHRAHLSTRIDSCGADPECAHAAGTAKEPNGASSSAGRRLARVRARLSGASSRYPDSGQCGSARTTSSRYCSRGRASGGGPGVAETERANRVIPPRPRN